MPKVNSTLSLKPDEWRTVLELVAEAVPKTPEQATLQDYFNLHRDAIQRSSLISII